MAAAVRSTGIANLAPIVGSIRDERPAAGDHQHALRRESGRASRVLAFMGGPAVLGWRVRSRPIREALLAACVYFGFFTLLTWPWITRFNTSFYADSGDGLQNVWNIWWINKAVTHLHQSPWHTTFLHYPAGTTLIAQTLNPFNGFVAIPLLRVLSLVQTYNTIVIFSFVFGGVTSFWLCKFATKKFVPSVIGGFIFTFSSYHLAHARGHLQLVSLEWIPLFVLLWWMLLVRPRLRLAAGAAVVLLLVLLCDYYYFLYCLAAAALVLVYLAYRRDIPAWRSRATYGPFLFFGLLAVILCVPLPLALLRSNGRDKFLGGHNARIFSTDLLSPIIDGGLWRFGSYTRGYWHHVVANTSESTVYLGISVLTLVVIALVKRTSLHRDTTFWLVFSLIFFVFSLGPRSCARPQLQQHSFAVRAARTRRAPHSNSADCPCA